MTDLELLLSAVARERGRKSHADRVAENPSLHFLNGHDSAKVAMVLCESAPTMVPIRELRRTTRLSSGRVLGALRHLSAEVGDAVDVLTPRGESSTLGSLVGRQVIQRRPLQIRYVGVDGDHAKQRLYRFVGQILCRELESLEHEAAADEPAARVQPTSIR